MGSRQRSHGKTTYRSPWAALRLIRETFGRDLPDTFQSDFDNAEPAKPPCYYRLAGGPLLLPGRPLTFAAS
jgi:hypothetical protein